MAFITGMLCLVLLLVVLLAIVPIMEVSHEQLNTTSAFDWAGIDELIVTSENLQNGVWDDSIANTERGKNLSPQLSWEKAENAQELDADAAGASGNIAAYGKLTGTYTK